MTFEPTEADIQRAFMEIATEKCLTVATLPGDQTRAYVPGHWRDEATTRAKANHA